MVTTSPLTVEQFLEWSADLEHPYELIDGIPTRVPTERYLNTLIARLLSIKLLTIFEVEQLTTAIEVELDAGNTRIPDFCVVALATAGLLGDLTRAMIRSGTEPPLIAVEVVSPSKR
ncbi:MAG: Uma2 family endonuclease [Cyanobacteria bacterium P01_H01_bin.121]